MGLGYIPTIALILSVFMLGWIAATVQTTHGTIESPMDYRFLYRGSFEKHSPADRIKEGQIRVYDDKVTINLAGATWATYADTNSMDPVFDKGANGIELPPQSPDDLIVGDVISFAQPAGTGLVVHRIIEISTDSEGWFARTRGDNNLTDDPDKIRFDQIHGVLVGILY